MPHAGTTARQLEKQFKPGFMLVRVRNGHFRVANKRTLEPVRMKDGRPIDLPFSPRADMVPELRKDLIEAGVIARPRVRRKPASNGMQMDEEALRRAEAARAEWEADHGSMPKVTVKNGVIEPALKEVPMEEFLMDSAGCGPNFWTRCARCGALVDIRRGDSHMRVVHGVVYD